MWYDDDQKFTFESAYQRAIQSARDLANGQQLERIRGHELLDPTQAFVFDKGLTARAGELEVENKKLLLLGDVL